MPAGGTLGTFAGVFTPSILTILGIILFLRLGYVVGGAGIARAFVIIGLANAISILTSLSLAAIATNLKVKGGGDYYLISRTLGVEFGGAIGIVLFLAQSVSIAFYCIGFSEAVTALLPEGMTVTSRTVALGALGFLFVFAWLGADWATRLQYGIMAILFLALVSFFAGGLTRWSGDLFLENWRPVSTGIPFWALFAIFFPAVTGFTQGVSMSGDLKDPGKSIPQGTFWAVGLSIVVYFAVAVVFAGTLPATALIRQYGAMREIAMTGFLIDAGVIGATLSSAMASFLGAPRILQSMAKDRIFPWMVPFAKGVGHTDNPRRGVLLSFAIAVITVSLGDLNMIAPVVSMFFLVSYGLLNYATFYEARALSPSFRPRFRWFDHRVSLLGCLTCLAVMLAIDLTAGVIAVAVLSAVYQYLKRTAGPARWADSNRSHHLQQLREHLFEASIHPEHPRDWRPQLLALSNDADRRAALLRFGSWIQGRSGVMTAVRILEGEGVKLLKAKQEAVEELQEDITGHGVDAFPLVMIAPSLETGLQGLVQAYGVGPLKANTLLLNWMGKVPERVFAWREESYRNQLRTAFRQGCNIIVLDAKEKPWLDMDGTSEKDRRIDVWWADDATGHLSLLLAHLLTKNDDWREAEIHVLGMRGEEAIITEPFLAEWLEEVRIEAQTTVVSKTDSEAISRHSQDATLVFLPFRLGRDRMIGPMETALNTLLPHLPPTALVLAAEDIDLDASPEEGEAGALAAALDGLEDAKAKAAEAEKDARAALEAAEDVRKRLEEGRATHIDKDTLHLLQTASEKADESAEKAARRVAKAKAKVEDAEKEVEALNKGG